MLFTQSEEQTQTPVSPTVLTKAETTGHLLFLDGLRALAALYVVLHHSWLEVWPSIFYHKAPQGEMARWSGWLAYGHFAVALFIVLSGFSLMLSVTRNGNVLRGGAKTFYWRRVKRIVPPYYFAMLVSMILIRTLVGKKTGTHWDLSVSFGRYDVIRHVLLLQDILKSGAINHSFWSIAVEFHYYLLFPLLVLGWRKFGAFAALGTVFLLSCIGIGISEGNPAFYFVSLPLFPFFTLFVLGMLGTTICYDKGPNWRRLRDSVPWLWLAALLGPLTFLIEPTRFYDAADFTFGLACMSLLIGIGRSPTGTLRTVLSWRPLVFIGGFSYSLYLIHAPLIQVFWQYILHPLHRNENTTFLLLAFTGTPCIVAAAYLFYWFCERPFIPKARV